LRVRKTCGSRHSSHTRGGNGRFGCGPCVLYDGGSHTVRVLSSLSWAKGPRPQSDSDAGGISTISAADGVAPESASTATAGGATSATAVAVIPHVHSLISAILHLYTCSGQAQQVLRPDTTTSANTVGRRRVPGAVMPSCESPRPISGELALLMWNSSKNCLGWPQCLRLRRPAHKVSKLPVLPVGVRV